MALILRKALAFARTTTFQLTISYTIVFGISLSVLALFFYWSTIGVVVRETDRIVEEEVRVLSKVYRERGLDWLIKTLSVRARLTRKMLYQFASPDGQPLAGNLKSWPIAETNEDGWVEFTYVLPQSEVVVPARGRISRLPDGVQFLVARNIEEISQIKNVFKRSLQVVISLTIIFALVGGLYMSRRVLRRIAAFTKATGEIVDGGLNRRLESRLTGDEFDVLAEHLNEMLDKIESLVGTVRHVSDNIAHDLRTPLTRLRNKIEVVAASSPESLRAELESSVADADELLLTFASLLRIARIESGTYSPTLEKIDLSVILADAADLYQGVASERNVVLVSDTDPSLVINGDRNLMFQAISNLLDNAVKNSPSQGAVGLVATEENNEVQVRIHDNGPGIPEEEYDRVLERFSRLDQSRSLPGSGLGLSVVKAVVELHAGTLRFRNNDPGLMVELKFPSNKIL